MNDDLGYNSHQECTNGNATTSAVIVTAAAEANISSPDDVNNFVHVAGQFVNNSVIVPNATNITFPIAIPEDQLGLAEGVEGQVVHYNANLPVNTNCAICGDKATGKHYGASSCDGCKGFFRRSVRHTKRYSCASKNSKYHCTIDKAKRNQCRFCRLGKCFRAGMKKEAVQNERDKISIRKSSYEDGSLQDGISLAMLCDAEISIRQNSRQYTINFDPSNTKIATVEDVCDSMKQQLLTLVEWAKHIDCFVKLTIDDQVALLRAHAGDHLLLGLAIRSLHLNEILLLGNDFVIPRSDNSEFSVIGCRVMDELVHPLRRICIDVTEFACFKAVVFFDPNAKGLKNYERIYEIRKLVHIMLEDYMNDKQYDPRGRFAQTLLTIPILQSITMQMKQQLQIFSFASRTKLDDLLQEMLLGGPQTDAEPIETPMEESPSNVSYQNGVIQSHSNPDTLINSMNALQSHNGQITMSQRPGENVPVLNMPSSSSLPSSPTENQYISQKHILDHRLLSSFKQEVSDGDTSY